MLKEVNDEVSNFFREKGFLVTWDCGGLDRWYELYLNGNQFLQIDMGIPLEDLLSDLKNEWDEIDYKSKKDYSIRGPVKNFKKFLEILFNTK